jgi:hypothetical protein
MIRLFKQLTFGIAIALMVTIVIDSTPAVSKQPPPPTCGSTTCE